MTTDTPLPPRADLVIVGGGVMGLAVAYNLCKLGHTDIVVLERGYLAGGASGRNGGGIRQQFAAENTIRLMQESVKLCNRFAKELRVNIWFRQGGYLFLARTAEELARLEKNIDLQHRCGVQTKMISAQQARDIVPQLEIRDIVGAAYNATDGILFPWPFLWGYANRARELGAQLHTHTAVTRIDAEKSGGFTVHTPRGAISARRVLNASGAWSPAIADMVGVKLPTHPMRHEICASEPLKPFLKPMVSLLSSGLYVSQSMRGEIIGGISLPGESSSYSVAARMKFAASYARELVQLMPVLGDVKMMRQWAGPYDISPDGNPLLGCPDAVPEFYLCSGFMGHGFMMAPIIGHYYAQWLAGGKCHEFFEQCRLARFTDGSAIAKEDFSIG